ncbi:hypothetical protein [Campylobacter taeniopygiae]|uniref:hypothetical protein n=1 Tax=Campylobacter taeniopygiae TaxID=2510188 RepID=UPI003D6B30C8
MKCLNEINLKTDYGELEKELDNFSQKESLKIEIDQGLEKALKELEILSAKLPKEQTKRLFEQCSQNAMKAVTGSFGFASIILEAKDGGNVTTTRNFKKGITATEEDLKKYEDWNKGYNRDGYDKEKDKIRDNSPRIVTSEYTGEEMERGAGKGKAQLDHVISVKEIDRNPKTHLFLKEGIRKELANNPDNLKWLEASANASKGDKDLMEWGREIDSETGKTNFEKHGIDEKKAEEIYNKAKSKVTDEILKNEILKYSKDVLTTGAKDAAKIAIYSVLGVVLKDLVKAIIIELKTTIKEFGNESIKEIFIRFKNRMEQVWKELKLKWKDILKGSIESGIQAFFSNFIIFVINLFATTLKKMVQIIRAGFSSLCQAVKTILNPPENISKDDIYFEASKIFITGMISSVTMLGSEMIHKFLMSIPGFNAFLVLPIPFTGETIGDALSLCISAVSGAILSTIAIFYMDKWNNNSKIGRLQIQIVTQNNIVAQYKIAQTWFALGEAYELFDKIVETGSEKIAMLKNSLNENKSKLEKAKEKRDKVKNKLIIEFNNLQG